MTAPLLPLAHAVGARGDLPLPLWLVSWGAAAVLIASFALLGRAWREPRWEHRESAGPVVLPPAPARALGLAVRVVGVGLVGLVWAASIAGPDSITQNLAPYAVFVAFWVGVQIVSGVAGDVWYLLSPFETTLHATGNADAEPVERFGVYPAAVLLLLFVWIELVHPHGAQPRVLAQAIGVYVAVMAIGVAWYGWGWLRSAEAFGVLFGYIARMAPLYRDGSGQLRLRPPLVGLAGLRPIRGTAAVVLVALGSTTFDGVTRLPAWEDLVAGRSGWEAVPTKTLGLLLTIGAVSLLYWWSMREAAARTGRPTRELVDLFVHSLVPIALAYVIAHYFSLVVFEGQRLLALSSDPFGLGWDLLGTGDWAVDYRAMSPALIAWVQAGSIVVGHVAGVVLAHDRAVAHFPGRDATRSQYALLVAMVGYTIGGLVLLLGG